VGGGEVSVFAAAGDAAGCSFDGSSGRSVAGPPLAVAPRAAL